MFRSALAFAAGLVLTASVGAAVGPTNIGPGNGTPTVDNTCSELTLAPSGSRAMTREEVAQLSPTVLTAGGSLAEELATYNISVSELNVGTELPVMLPGGVPSSVYVLEREIAPIADQHTWVILYSTAPNVVRAELERRRLPFPWSGFIVSLDATDRESPIQVSLLGHPNEKLLYDPAARTFRAPAISAPLNSGATASACVTCILGLVRSIVCEAVADGISCATVAGCPGAIISALIRASWKLLTSDLCFAKDLSDCRQTCFLPTIRITPASDSQLQPGHRSIGVDISGTNAGAWALPLPTNGGAIGPPLIKIGPNPRTLDWNAQVGVYSIYAGNIPLTTNAAIAKNTNIAVGNAAAMAVNWAITDGCFDNEGLRVRFFDRTHNAVFPSQGYYSVPSGGARTFSFTALRGSDMCIGAVQDPPGTTYWCCGINGEHSGDYSPLCHSTIPLTGAFQPSNRLTCDN